MDHFAGLDVSVKDTNVCIVDDTGRLVREVKVASEPAALLPVLTNPAYHFKRIGLEAGPLSQWLFSALAEAGLPVICVETRHMRAVLKAQINKTDRNDARGIAQMMRAGLYRPVHVKTLRSQKLRMLLTHRKLLQSKAIAVENDLRATLRNFGLKVGMVGTVKFEARIRELVENLSDLAVLVEPLLVVRRVLHEQIGVLHRRLLAVVRDDEVCRRLMTVPGVGPVVALTYRATVDVPARFKNSKAVGAVFGLTPSRYQSGVSDRTGLVELATGLRARGIEIVATDGTRRALADAGIEARAVSEVTGHPEMLDGRVKTLHPKVHGGILHRREDSGHRAAVAEHSIPAIDMVVVNLYAFKETAAQPGVHFEELIENIDIGGPSMIRSAAKNFQDVAVVTSPA